MPVEIYPDTKVYVMCPAFAVTAGPKTLHQLGAALRAQGVDAYMHYYNWLDKSLDPVAERYKPYKVPYVRLMEDSPRNVLVLPETAGDYWLQPRHMRRVIWWMSVNNYYRQVERFVERAKSDPTHIALPRFFTFSHAEEVYHLAQSECARLFLQVNGVPENRVSVVSDFVEDIYLEKAQEAQAVRPRWRIVAYNGASHKQNEITDKLREIAPDIYWRPLKELSMEQMQHLLSLASVYIDFGPHPGKDHIPREAAISGCCVITGRRGSAGNPVDIPIPEEFKFEDKLENVPAILAKIRYLLDHYEEEQEKFRHYREVIQEEPAVFRREVAEAFPLAEGMI